uniref:Amino acid transporter n=1 Tax=Mesocestoides corti TaxID=53468 RepID=A0A5K3FEN7_MESCO
MCNATVIIPTPRPLLVVLADLNPKENGKVSGVALGYILSCNLISSLIGLAYSYIIKPGASVGNQGGNATESGDSSQISYIFRDLLLNIFPDNIVGVTLFQAGTNFSNPIINAANEVTYESITLSGTNMIGVLFCSVVFGLATNVAKEKGVPFKNFFGSLGEVVMLLMQKFLLVTPVGVMFMVMSAISEVDDLTNTFISLGLFIALNFAGQITHFILLLLSLVCLGKNPFRILRLCLPPYFIAFATTSGIVSLPKCYDACDTYGIPKAISRFVLPIAGTMKSDASAIFIVGSVFFVAQMAGVNLDAGKVVIVVILATAYVSALPNIPSASVVAVITILNSIGVDAGGASLLYAVEWLNDRLRSGNVALSHMYCTTFVYHCCEKDFKADEEIDDEFSEQKESDYDN